MPQLESGSFSRPSQENLLVPERNMFPSFSKEHQIEILELVDFCALCVERYFKDFAIPTIPRESFFVYAQGSSNAVGRYDPRFHAFGVREDALHMPKVYIHEMIHFISRELVFGSTNTGYEFLGQTSVNGQPLQRTFYQALNEGMTDLMSEEIYSNQYKDIRHFFQEHGGLGSVVSAYSDSIIFVQKLITYSALLLVVDENISEEDAHHKVWNTLKSGYLKNDYKYLEQLFETFGDSEREKEETIVFIQELDTTERSKEGLAILTQILDKKIILSRQSISSQT